MGSRKMTFSLPEEIAIRFVRQVPSRDRSRYVAEALTHRLTYRDEQLAKSCEAANADAGVIALEREMDLLSAEVSEPWDESAAR
jgi:hypothetical protein